MSSLKDNHTKSAKSMKRTIYGCVGNLKDSEIANLFDLSRVYSPLQQELRQIRTQILEGDKFVTFWDGIYDGTEWYDEDIRVICREWYDQPGITEVDVEGNKGWYDVDGDGELKFTQCYVMTCLDPKHNHQQFAQNSNFGQRCKELCGRVPSIILVSYFCSFLFFLVINLKRKVCFFRIFVLPYMKCLDNCFLFRIEITPSVSIKNKIIALSKDFILYSFRMSAHCYTG